MLIHAPIIGLAGLDPGTESEQYIPPFQSNFKKQDCFFNSLSLNNKTEHPLGL